MKENITMVGTRCFLSIVVMMAIASIVSFASPDIQPPATYHLTFETMDFLSDDFSALYDEPNLEQRNLRLVPGRFGKALLNASTFSREDLEKTSMSTWDLDVLLEVIAHHHFAYWKELHAGHMEPYIWGTGRLKGDGGCVAFWAKGKRTYPGYLFFQGSSSFGRFEKYLLGIELKEDRTVEAFVRDARYTYHRIKSVPVWNENTFNHVALSWDRAMGLVLYVNGIEVASNWGRDAWWTTQIPGLFHMPMCGFTYDEVWMFDRPLTGNEINRLMKENRSPSDAKLPEPYDQAAVGRLRSAFIGNDWSSLPSVKPSDGTSVVCFREVFPEWAGDGCVESPFVLDGKYELAWPQDYTSFTNILGDSDFHPEKVDFRLPENGPVNYIAVEGNLTDASVLAGNGATDSDFVKQFDVPQGNQFFYGAAIPQVSCSHFRIPFLKSYGSPPGYEEGLHIALSGDIRIHEVGFYNVSAEPANSDVQTKSLFLGGVGQVPDDRRTGYAMRTLNDLRSSRIVSLESSPQGRALWIRPEPLTRLNLLSSPWEKSEAVRSIEMNVRFRGIGENDFMILRLHDPGVPARIWNSVVFRLNNFNRGSGTLRLKLDCTDIKLAAGDRLWIDIAFSGDSELQAGGNGSSLLVETAPLSGTDSRYAEKALKPARSDFTKIYYWYYPWTATRQVPETDAPVTFGGFFDIVTCPLMVTRTEPDNFVANVILDLALVKNPSTAGKGFTIDGANAISRDSSPELWPPVIAKPNDGSPEWAFCMHYYLTRYRDIMYWWADRQNSDGQVGGGWNDDVLFASRLPGVFLYCGDAKARRIFNRIFEGLEDTRMFRDGYCNIDPMDYMHVEDLVRNRYEGLLFEPGDPRKMKIAMRTAWRFGKPDKTPLNYIDGNSFKYDNEFIRWYWGERPAYPAFSATREQVTDTMKKIAPAMDAIIRFRYTEAGMFTDGAYMPGSSDIERIQVGGGWGPFVNNLSFAVSWEKGGEPEIPKWVETATDTSFVAHFYSFDTVEREVCARLYRLVRGAYRIRLAYEGDDASLNKHGIVLDRTARLRRFSEVSVPVRPERELVLRVELVRRLPDPGPLPDLAVYSAERAGNQLNTVVMNFGAAPASGIVVRLVDRGGKTIAEHTIGDLASAEDFVPGEASFSFLLNPDSSGSYRVIVDPEDAIEEIYEGNNGTEVKM